MVKCFWCSTVNRTGAEYCVSCGRSIKWSPFLQSVLRRSIGGIMGARPETLAAAQQHGHAQSSYPAA